MVVFLRINYQKTKFNPEFGYHHVRLSTINYRHIWVIFLSLEPREMFDQKSTDRLIRKPLGSNRSEVSRFFLVLVRSWSVKLNFDLVRGSLVSTSEKWKYNFRTKNCIKTNEAVYTNQSEVHVRIKCNPFKIENFYKNTLILSTSFIGLSAPLYIFLSKDWSESTQEESSSK